VSREPEQLDLLDWLAAQPPGPGPIRPAPAPRPDPAISAPLLLTRVESSCNMRRFYSLALVTSLFGEHGVARQWGRIGNQGQRRTDWYASPEAAAAELEGMAGRKRRRGYR
jgi:predicted DNA-binding WGR domain protein